MEIMGPVLAGAGVIALLALAYLFWRVTKTLEVLDSTLDEANTTIKEMRGEAIPLIAKAGVTVDAVNMELLRIDAIISTVENATKKVEKTSDSISDLVNTPVDVVTDFAGRVRTAIRERRAGAQDARRIDAITRRKVDPDLDDEELLDEYYDDDDIDGGIDDDGFVVLEESEVYQEFPAYNVVEVRDEDEETDFDDDDDEVVDDTIDFED